MSNLVNAVPLLPNPAEQYDKDLNRALTNTLSEYARRINGSMQKDGSEPMEGNLDLGGFSITNVANITLSGTATAAHLVATIDATAPLVNTNGIVFPATQVPSAGANTLDDYEEGTYTPTITSSVGTITTVSATGRYTKVGRKVSVDIQVVITTIGTGAGNLQATLPFTAAAGFNSVGGIRNNSVGPNGGASIVLSNTAQLLAAKYDGTSIMTNGNLSISATYAV